MRAAVIQGCRQGTGIPRLANPLAKGEHLEHRTVLLAPVLRGLGEGQPEDIEQVAKQPDRRRPCGTTPADGPFFSMYVARQD